MYIALDYNYFCYLLLFTLNQTEMQSETLTERLILHSRGIISVSRHLHNAGLQKRIYYTLLIFNPLWG